MEKTLSPAADSAGGGAPEARAAALAGVLSLTPPNPGGLLGDVAFTAGGMSELARGV